MTVYTPSDLTDLMLSTARQLDEAQAELVRLTHEHSAAERRYRQAKATAYLATSGTVGERESAVAKAVDGEQYAAHLGEGLVKAALEAVRNRRQVLSSLQTIASSVREEAALARTGPGY